MAVIGYLGTSAEEGIIFEASSEKTETPDNGVWFGSSRYPTHPLALFDIRRRRPSYAA